MKCFGDESGHLNNLLQGDCDLFVLAVVTGDPITCMTCPKRTVRDVQDVAEAKWSDLTEIQKRRLIECFVEQGDDLLFGYAAFTLEDLHSFEYHHLFYEDEAFPCPWDLCVIGDTYAELFSQLQSEKPAISSLTFDRLFSKRMSDKIVGVVNDTHPNLSVNHGNSHQVKGIQAADCFAGAVADDIQGKSDWLDQLNENQVHCVTDFAKAQIENRLYDVRTGP